MRIYQLLPFFMVAFLYGGENKFDFQMQVGPNEIIRFQYNTEMRVIVATHFYSNRSDVETRVEKNLCNGGMTVNATKFGEKASSGAREIKKITENITEFEKMIDQWGSQT